MATATKTPAKKTPTKTPTAKAPVEKKEPVAKEVKPKVEPKFTVSELWALGKDFSASARSGLNDFKEGIEARLKDIEADPKTYRDHVTAAKFLLRRAERVELSLDELNTGLKERAPRAEKPASEKKPRAKKETPVVDEDDEDEDLEDSLDDDEDEEDEDTDLDEDELDD